MKRLLIVMVALGVVGGVGTRTVDALTQLTPISVLATPVGGPFAVDVYELKCPSGATILEAIVTDSEEDGDPFHVILTGLSPAPVYGRTFTSFAQFSIRAAVSHSRPAPGAIKALLHVRRDVGGFSGLYDLEFNCLGEGGVNKKGSIRQMQDQ